MNTNPTTRATTTPAQPVVWFEVMSQDVAAQQRFYGELFGWRFESAPGVPDYGMVSRDASVEASIPGGVGASPTGAGWLTFYVETADLEAKLAEASQLGGQPHGPIVDLPDGGRIALVRDPEGHLVGLVQSPAS